MKIPQSTSGQIFRPNESTPKPRNPKTLGGRALTCSRGRNAIMSRPRNPKTLGGRTLRCSRGRNAIMTPPRNPETRNPKTLGGRTFRCSRGRNACYHDPTPKPRNPKTLGGRTFRCAQEAGMLSWPHPETPKPETRNPKALGGRTFRCSRGRNAIMTPPRNPETRKCFVVVSDRILWSQVTPCTVEVLLALSVNMRFCGRKWPHFVVISDPESFTGVCGRKWPHSVVVSDPPALVRQGSLEFFHFYLEKLEAFW